MFRRGSATVVLGFVVLASSMALGSSTFAAGDGGVRDVYLVQWRPSAPPVSPAVLGLPVTVDYGRQWLVEATTAQANLLRALGWDVRAYPQRYALAFESAGFAFDLRAGEPAVPQALARSAGPYYVVKFEGPPKPDWRDTLAAAGAEIVDHASRDAYVIRAPALTLLALRALPHVSWAGYFHPAYTVDAQLASMGGPQPLLATFYRGESTLAAVSRLEAAGAVIDKVDVDPLAGFAVSLVADVAAVPQIARIPGLQSIAYHPPVELHAIKASALLGAHEAWYGDTSGYTVEPPNVGLTGKNQIVGDLDTGFDTGNTASGHYDFFRGPVPGPYPNGDRVLRLGGSDPDDENGHGTATSGLILGNGYCLETQLAFPTNDREYHRGMAGIAPEATLSLDILNVVPPLTAWTSEYNSGARVLSNSWGSGTGYLGNAANADSFTYPGRQDVLIVASAGNSGPGGNTIGAPSLGKNVLSIGASGNDRTADPRFPSDPNRITDFSSRGPASTGWGKPDVVAPGESVVTTQSSRLTSDDASDDYACDVFPEPAGDGRQDYQWFSGTSASAPLAAGSAAIVRQYYEDVRGMLQAEVTNPLVRATLINGAVDIGYGYPYQATYGYAWSYDQGWGRVNLKNSLFPDPPTSNQYALGTLTTSGELWDAAGNGGLNLNLVSGRVPFRITLVWMDPAGSSLSNHLDLIVIAPDGKEYHGNQFANSWSVDTTQLADYDTYNTVENVYLQTPVAGAYTVMVSGTVVGGGAGAPFALVVSGDFGLTKDYQILMIPKSPTAVTSVAGGSVTFVFGVLNFGLQNDVVQLLATNLPPELSVTFAPVLPGDLVILNSGQEANITAYVSVSNTTMPGLYEFKVEGRSTQDPLGQAKDSLTFRVDVLAVPLPPKIQVTANSWYEGDPTVLVQDVGGLDHVWITYLGEEPGLGKRVYLKHSDWTRLSADGNDWDRCSLTNLAEGPEDPRILRLASGRFYVTWHGNEASPPAAEQYGVVRGAYIDDPMVTDWAADCGNWQKDVLVDENTGACNIMPNDAKRRVVPVEHGSRLYVVMELLGYSSFTASDISTTDVIARWSDDGGATWPGADFGSFDTSHCLILGDGPGGIIEFFPHPGRDAAGNLFIAWYDRTGAGANAERDLWYRKISPGPSFTVSAKTAVPGGQVAGWDDQFPFVFGTDEGTNGARDYVLWMTERYTGEDWHRMVTVYTDDPNNCPATCTWTPVVPSSVGYGGLVSQSGFTTGRDLISSARTSDNYIWTVYMEGINDYDAGQVYVLYTNDAFGTVGVYKITADGFGKGHPTIATSGTNVYVAYHAYSATGQADVWVTRFNLSLIQGLLPDTLGPVVTVLNPITTEVYAGNDLTVTAVLDDTNTGFSDISQAQYVWDDPMGTWTDMTAVGVLDSAVEAFETTASTTGLLVGPHVFYVKGRDILGNWGPPRGATINIRSPDCCPPEAPVLLGAYVDPASPADVVIRWARSNDEGSPGGTIQYQVNRASAAAGPYTPAGPPVVADLSPVYEWRDVGAAANLFIEFYRVMAVDGGNNAAFATATAAKFVRTGLAAGRVLLSAPVTSLMDSPPDYFASFGANYEAAWTYDGGDALDPWKSYATVKGRGDLAGITAATGLWVELSGPDDFVVAGLVAGPTNVQLFGGWNLVGVPTFATTLTANDLFAIGATKVQAWANAPPYDTVALSPSDPLVPGEAYWVQVNADAVWSVP